MSILAGIFISLGAIVYLKVGGVLGAVLFSIGLMSVLAFEGKLFTGKAGLLASKEIKWWELALVWCGNLVGCAAMACLVVFTPLGVAISGPAAAITAVRLSNGFLVNILMGIVCGMLMYIAVSGYNKTGNWLFAIIPVAVFILSGFNHCVADMFYCFVARNGFLTIIPTTLGNIIGCNIIPIAKKLFDKYQISGDRDKQQQPVRRIGY